MRYIVEQGRLRVQREPEEKEDLLRRLRRIEGQVRGLQQMIEDDRYCLEVVQQINATSAALREVSLREIGDHLQACVDFAGDAHDGQEAVKEMLAVLRTALRQ